MYSLCIRVFGLLVLWEQIFEVWRSTLEFGDDYDFLGIKA